MKDKDKEMYLHMLLACGKKRGDKIIITPETIREVDIKLKILKMVVEMQEEK